MTRSRGTNSRHPEWPASPHEQQPQSPRYAEYDPRTGAAHPSYARPAEPGQPKYADPSDAYYAAGQHDAAGNPVYYQGHTGNPAEAADPWQRLGATAGQPHFAPPHQPPVEDPGVGYHYPSAQGGGASGEPDYYADQSPPPYQPAPDAADAHANFAPQFDPYQRAPAGDPSGYAAEPDPTQSLSGFPRPGYTRHDDGHPGYTAQPELRGGSYDHSRAPGGFDQGDREPAPAGMPHPAWPVAEPAAFTGQSDSQSYMPLRHDGGQIPRYADDPISADRFAAAPQFGSPYDGGHYNPVAPQDNEYESEFEDDDGDEGYHRGSSHLPLIAAVLIGSVVVGGGLAYGYNTLFSAPSGSGGDAPVIKADGGPARIAPADPGGRKFSHTDSGVLKKMAKRLPAAAAGTKPDDGATPDGNRTKMVTTMIFDRQGRLVVKDGGRPAETARPGTTNQTPPTSAQPPGADQPLPGLTIMNGNAFGQPAQPNAARPGKAQPPAVEPKVVAITKAPTARVPPRRRGATPGAPPLPTRSPNAASGGGTAEPPQNADTAIVRPVRPPVRQPPPQVAPVVRAKPPARPAPRGGAANGYVAVLSTKKTRIDALKSYADLQQKYSSVLAASIPSVQVADLRSRGLGKMYRAVVGPPGSRQAAQKVCSRLRSAGYKSCWVKAF